MIKKTIITFFVIISTLTYSYATEGSCLILNKASDDLLEYIKNNRIVITNLTNEIIESNNQKHFNKKDKGFFEETKDGIKETLNNSYNESESIFNEIFNFDGYTSYFNYYVTFPISNKVSSEVKRDYKLLDNENKGLLKFLKGLDEKGNSDLVIKNACKGVNVNCELDNKSVKEIMKVLIQTNDDILNLFRLSVIGEEKDFLKTSLPLTSNNFVLNIKKDYSKLNTSACNSEEGGFFEQITDAIKNIQLLNEEGRDGIKKWEYAWQLLIGNKPEDEAKIEKEQLKKYLGDKGVSLDNKKIVQENLKNYNQDSLSINNNFLSNTLSSIGNKLTEEYEEWHKEVVGDFFDAEKKNNADKIAIKDVSIATDNKNITISLANKMSELYNKELPFAAIGDTTTEKLRAKIINTHISIESSITKLEETIVLSKKVCGKQGGGGKCK